MEEIMMERTKYAMICEFQKHVKCEDSKDKAGMLING